MIDKIKAEADAIGCEKEQRIKELERERDEALAYAERLLGALNMQMAISGGVESGDSVYKRSMAVLTEQPPAALASLKAEWQAKIISELKVHMMNNGYGDESDGVCAWFEERQLAQDAGNE